MNIWLVDAFTSEPYTGNSAAVVVVSDFFDDAVSVKIAEEVHQVETAFVKILSDNHCHIRWFAPTKEVAMCGHATLAAAHILWEEGFIKGSRITFDSLSGPLLLSKSPLGICLELPLQSTGETVDAEPFAEILKMRPICVVPAGDDFIVELSDPETLRRLEFDISKLLDFDCRAVIVTSRGDNGYDFISRLFAPRIGIFEDAVSGASHSKLADFWRKRTGKSKFHAFQASARGGELHIEIVDSRVHIIGKAVTVVKGALLHHFPQSSQEITERG